MYAVVVSGGKQHRVQAGDLVRVEKIEGEVGQSITLEQVLLIGGETFKLGTPRVAGAQVTAEIVRQARALQANNLRIQGESAGKHPRLRRRAHGGGRPCKAPALRE